MLRRWMFGGSASLFVACAQAAPPTPNLVGTIAPPQAVTAAAAAPTKGIRGDFSMLVRTTGKSHGHVFLNSELDYRDQRNLSIDIGPYAVGSLTRQFGMAPDKFFKNKWIVAHGTARRVTIRVFDDFGKPTQVYYFQTHVPVMRASQIDLLPVPKAS